MEKDLLLDFHRFCSREGRGNAVRTPGPLSPTGGHHFSGGRSGAAKRVAGQTRGLRRISPARASWLVFLPVERLAEYQQVQRERVRGCHPDMEAACTLSD